MKPGRLRASRAVLAALSGLAGLACSVARAAPCDDAQAMRAASGSWQVALLPAVRPLPVGRHFALEVQLCSPVQGVRALRVDADMPAHRHGMNYRTTVKPLGADRWRAEGLMLHMPGRWRFIVEFDTSGGVQRLTHEVDVQ
jgi:hypothetical protein